ncbi:cytochrome P450, partial [Acinetobacter baumannii]
MLVAADEPGSGIDDAQVAGNVLTMLLAGEDTTANTLAWMIWLLSRHPEALAQARAEVDRVLGDAALPDLSHLGQLDFVEACAHETMRLRPVAPINTMQAVHDTRVGDVAVPAGTLVMGVMRH